MPLPFDIAEVEQIKFAAPGVAEFGLPKLVSVTPAEELAIVPLLRETDSEGLVKIHTRLATIALQRLHPDQKFEDTLQLPKTLVVDLANFLLDERRGWEELDDEGDDGEKKAQTGTNTKSKRGKPLAKSTGESAPDGQTSSTGKNSDTPPST